MSKYTFQKCINILERKIQKKFQHNFEDEVLIFKNFEYFGLISLIKIVKSQIYAKILKGYKI